MHRKHCLGFLIGHAISVRRSCKLHAATSFRCESDTLPVWCNYFGNPESIINLWCRNVTHHEKSIPGPLYQKEQHMHFGHKFVE